MMWPGRIAVPFVVVAISFSCASVFSQETEKAEQKAVTVDVENKRVELAGQICRRKGILELFACLKGTKEHESIIALDAKPSQLAYALAQIGLEPGTPAAWTESGAFRPPSGPVMKVMVRYKSAQGKDVLVDAENWLLNSDTKEPISEKLQWVYCFEGTGEAIHLADADGTAITLSNFASAVLDVPFESTDVDVDLLFEANPKEIPPVGTPVTIVLVPTGKRIESKKIEIAIVLKKGELPQLDGKAMELDKLEQAVEATPFSITAASLKAEAGVPFGDVMAVMEILRKGRFRVHLALLKPDDGAAEAKKLTICVHKDGSVTVNGKCQSLEDFKEAVDELAYTYKTAAVVPDSDAEAETVSEIVKILSSAGIDFRITAAKQVDEKP